MQITWKRFHAEYTEEKVKRYVPSNAGIYLLCVKLKNGTWRCFYVGQTNRLDHRLLEHLSDLEENDCIRKRVGRKVCGFRGQLWLAYSRIGMQSRNILHDRDKPVCNQEDPGGTPIVVNLPPPPPNRP